MWAACCAAADTESQIAITLTVPCDTSLTFDEQHGATCKYATGSRLFLDPPGSFLPQCQLLLTRYKK